MNIHFIGIGGIGVSALAQYYLSKNHKVTGSDLSNFEIIEVLKKRGAKIIIGEHKSENLPKNTDLVIYSPAVQESNPELKKAKSLRIKTLTYPQALGKLTKKHFTIAVSGTHGKSTVTAMIGLILIKAGLDPTVILGTKLKEFGNSNFREGKSNYLVIEADEWKAAFLNYWPKVIVLTNIEKEHLDYYKNLNHILRTYKEYISHLPKEGVLIANGKDENVRKIVFDCQSSISPRYSIFNFQSLANKEEGKQLKNILKVPGYHNFLNALSAFQTAKVLGIDDKIVLQALSEYKGAWRRFEEKELKIGNLSEKIKLISDYGHHPTEVRVTLEAAKKKFKEKKVWLIFQPHQYQRTFYLFKEFVRVFQRLFQKPSNIAGAIITDIFDVPGRESDKIRKSINSKKLVKAVGKKEVIYLPKEEIVDYLKNNLKGGEVVIMMGAGDIYELSKKLSTDSS